MGIQLPPELADVAAAAGVQWPEADEDRMRQTARAWRDAGTELAHVTRDADHAARTALNAVDGHTGDAARRHWSTFVHPDNGHLTRTARDCAAAADRLDHAANQVGAAKLEIVRNLVALAKNTDAANHAASAGHPHALLGLDTAVRGTAANVAHITNNLVTAVQPGSGVDMSGVRDVANANPGHHNQAPGLLDPLVNTVQGATTLVTDTAQGATTLIGDTAQRATTLAGDAAQGGTTLLGDAAQGATTLLGNTAQGATTLVGDAAQGATNVVANPANLVGGTTELIGDTAQGTTNLVGDTARGAAGTVGDAVRGVADPGAPPLEPGGPAGPGHPDVTGPVRILPADIAGPGGVELPADAPTPPTGLPGNTVQAALAGGAVLDPAGSPQLQPNQPPGAAAPGAGQVPNAGPAPGGGGPVAAPPGGGPVASAPGGGAPPAGGPAPVPGRGPAGGPPPAPAPGRGAAPPAGGPPPAPVAPPADGSRARGQLSMAVPPGQHAAPSQPAAPVQAGVPKDSQGPDALFWVHMFPIGHMPVVSDRPARQLPPPPAEVDYAPGMRFAPGDHPEHHRVDAGQRLDELRAGVPPLEPPAGLPADHPRVAVLAEGHDPLGGQHERDWDRRYLVRLGSVTAQGISSEGKEYAWPPGESYPEGGSAAGEPELLAEGTVIDRFGRPDGRVFSADDTAFARRSLPPELLDAGYHRYRVTRALPVWRTVSAPWFGQPGGGERYRTTYSAMELLALGYLADITGGER